MRGPTNRATSGRRRCTRGAGDRRRWRPARTAQHPERRRVGEHLAVVLGRHHVGSGEEHDAVGLGVGDAELDVGDAQRRQALDQVVDAAAGLTDVVLERPEVAGDDLEDQGGLVGEVAVDRRWGRPTASDTDRIDTACADPVWSSSARWRPGSRRAAAAPRPWAGGGGGRRRWPTASSPGELSRHATRISAWPFERAGGCGTGASSRSTSRSRSSSRSTVSLMPNRSWKRRRGRGPTSSSRRPGA